MGNLLSLSERDMRLVKFLKRTDVLKNVRLGGDTDTTINSICIRCADCDIGPELDRHYHSHCGSERHQLFSLNGGALLLAKNEATRQAGLWVDGDVLMKHIRAAMKIKLGLSAISLFIHGPCGIAHEYDWSIVECIHYLMQAKQRLRDEINPHLDIIPFCHLVEDGVCRSFHVDRSAWYATMGYDPNEASDVTLRERLIYFKEASEEELARVGAG